MVGVVTAAIWIAVEVFGAQPTDFDSRGNWRPWEHQQPATVTATTPDETSVDIGDTAEVTRAPKTHWVIGNEAMTEDAIPGDTVIVRWPGSGPDEHDTYRPMCEHIGGVLAWQYQPDPAGEFQCWGVDF